MGHLNCSLCVDCCPLNDSVIFSSSFDSNRHMAETWRETGSNIISYKDSGMRNRKSHWTRSFLGWDTREITWHPISEPCRKEFDTVPEMAEVCPLGYFAQACKITKKPVEQIKERKQKTCQYLLRERDHNAFMVLFSFRCQQPWWNIQ